MAAFDRRLSDKALDALARMAEDGGGNWWRDLLSLWAPSGHEGELRLAIRDGSLNFYSCGQSLARITLARDGGPTLSVHAKYVTGRSEGPQEYVALRAGEGRDANGAVCAWGGPEMLRAWVANSARHRGVEKRHVEKAVADTPTVIDLEVGLPAGGAQDTALRMDMVALERRGDAIRVVFWEAKMIGDKRRLRSKTFEPEVLKTQMAAYERFLEPETNKRRVADAYRRACRLLGSIHEMARGVAPSLPALDPLILAAAEADSPLEIEPRPRLVVFDDGERRSEDHWQKHLAALRKHVHVTVLPFRPYGLPVLGGAA